MPLYLCDIGPLWIVTVLVISGITLFYTTSLIRTDHSLLAAAAISFLFMQITLNLLTVLSNPGLPDRDVGKQNVDAIRAMIAAGEAHYCSSCGVVKDPCKKTEHCALCQVCVEGYDHHCPWVGKCVGAGNIRYFYGFVGSTFALLVFLIISAALMRR